MGKTGHSHLSSWKMFDEEIIIFPSCGAVKISLNLRTIAANLRSNERERKMLLIDIRRTYARKIVVDCKVAFFSPL